MEFEVDASSRISKLKIISQIDVKLFYNKRKLLIIINTCAKKCVGGKIEKIENANASILIYMCGRLLTSLVDDNFGR